MNIAENFHTASFCVVRNPSLNWCRRPDSARFKAHSSDIQHKFVLKRIFIYRNYYKIREKKYKECSEILIIQIDRKKKNSAPKFIVADRKRFIGWSFSHTYLRFTSRKFSSRIGYRPRLYEFGISLSFAFWILEATNNSVTIQYFWIDKNFQIQTNTFL